MSVLFHVSLVIAADEQTPLQSATQLYDKGSYAAAAVLLEKVLKAEPNNSALHLLLGKTLAMQDDRGGAIRELTEAIRLEPKSAPSYSTLGMTLSRFEEIPAAREAFQTAVKLDPTLAEAHLNLGLLLAQSGDLDGAGAEFDRAIQLRGNHAAAAHAYYLRARVYVEQRRFPEATAALGHSVELDPKVIDSWLLLGAVCRANMDHAGALVAFKQAIRIGPKDPVAQYEIGSEYLNGGDSHDAATHLQISLGERPLDRATLYKLQRALREEKRDTEARKVGETLESLVESEDSIKRHSLAAGQLDNEGIALEKAGDIKDGLTKYRAALELDPGNDGFRINYGLALCRLGEWPRGIAELKQVVDQSPNNADARRALYIAMDKAKTPVESRSNLR